MPSGGEVEITGGINNRTYNLASLHTTPGHDMKRTYSRVMSVKSIAISAIRKRTIIGDEEWVFVYLLFFWSKFELGARRLAIIFYLIRCAFLLFAGVLPA